MGESGQSRREREKQQRRKHILDVAERLFATTGFYNTSVSDIAKEAEFGVGTLYKYFKDKDNLFEELIADRMSHYFEIIESVLLNDTEPLEKLKQYIRAHVIMLNEKKEFFKIFFAYVHPLLADANKSNTYDLSSIQQKREYLFSLLQGVVEEGISRRQFKKVDSAYVVAAIFGIHISVYFMQLHRNPNGDWDVEEMERSICSVFFDSILLDEGDR